MMSIFGEIGVGRILIAGAVSAVTAVVIEWVVVAWLFHDYQRLTPASWRPEGPREYFLSTCVTLASGFAFAVLFAMTGSTLTSRMGHGLPAGLLFGLACFVALPLPVILSQAIFVNLHRGFVAGLLLNSLLFCITCGVICAMLIA
ncbi:MAG: hypothetical protein ACHRXM_14825 [Isosphaerales bacterium]